jgi:hypothetical protein
MSRPRRGVDHGVGAAAGGVSARVAGINAMINTRGGHHAHRGAPQVIGSASSLVSRLEPSYLRPGVVACSPVAGSGWA